MFAGRQRPVKKTGATENQQTPAVGSASVSAPIRNSFNQAPATQAANAQDSSGGDLDRAPLSKGNKRTSLSNNNGTFSGLGSLNTSGNQLPQVAPYEGDDLNTLPTTVTDVMTIIRLSWDFMTNPEVCDSALNPVKLLRREELSTSLVRFRNLAPSILRTTLSSNQICLSVQSCSVRALFD